MSAPEFEALMGNLFRAAPDFRRQFPSRRKLRARARTGLGRRSWPEALEERVMLTVVDLTSRGASGSINGAIFYQFTSPGGGTGVFNPFVRIQSNHAIEQGYNTDYRPVQFDENTTSSFTRAIQLSSIPTVTAPGGLQYYEFVLDINQSSSPPNNLLSLDQLRVYVTNPSTRDPNLLHNYNSSTNTLQDDANNLYSSVYDLNAGSGGNYIKLDANLSSGSGFGDMVALIPVSSLGTNLSQYVYLYSEFGVHYANTSGFEQWDYGTAVPVGSISGQVYNDVNGNGQQDAGDNGLAGITVFLDANNNGLLDPGEVSTVSSSNGTFTFSNLVAGTYHVQQVLPANEFQTGRTNADVTLSSGQSASGVAFGDFLGGSVSGTIFEDKTGDGFSSDDPALNSANPDSIPMTVQLVQGSTVVASTLTDSNGNYRFTGVGPGTYKVQEVVPSGWIQTAATGATITATSGFSSTGNNFDDFKLGKIAGTLYQDLTGDGTTNLEVLNQNDPNYVPVTVQLYLGSSGTPLATTTTDTSGNYSFGNLGPGTYTIVNVPPKTASTGWIQTAPSVPGSSPAVPAPIGVTVTSGIVSTGNNFADFEAATLVPTNGALMISTAQVSGGSLTVTQPALTSTSVTLNGQNVGAFDATGLNSIQIAGNSGYNINTSQVSGTPVVISTAAPSFNTSTGQIGAGTTVVTGTSPQTVYGTLGTNAQILGSNGSYIETLSAAAASELDAAIGMFGTSPTALAGFGSTVSASGSFASIVTSILTNVQLSGNQNSFTQSFDPVSAQALQTALGFGSTVGALGAFGGTVKVNGGFNQIQTSALTSVTITGGTSSYSQVLDPNAAQVLQTALGFGSTVGALGAFGGTVMASGGFNQIQTSALAGVTLTGGTNSYAQALDPDAAAVLNNVIGGFGQHAGVLGGFASLVGSLGGFGGSVAASGGFNEIATSVLTSVDLSGGTNAYSQAIDPEAAQVLDQAIATIQSQFGGSTGLPGGFGATLNTLGGLGNTVDITGGFCQVQVSLLTSVTSSQGNLTYSQVLDPNAVQVLDTAIGAFGSALGASGGFGRSVGIPGGFGNSLGLGGGFNTISTSILTQVTASGGNNLYTQALDAGSLTVLAAAQAAIESYGSALGSLSGFGSSASLKGGYNNAQAGVLANVQLSGGYDNFVEQLTQGAVDWAGGVLSAAQAGGTGAVNAAAAAIGLNVALGNGDDAIVGGLLGTFTAGVGADRFVVEDPSLLGATSTSGMLLNYGGSFTGAAGTNTFYLVGKAFGHVAIGEPATNHDTLDLSNLQVSGPVLDLSTSAEQQVTSQLWLTLEAPGAFQTVISNGSAPILKAGSQNVILEGAAPLDDRTANPAIGQAATQVVFLDFDTYTTGTKHSYNTNEQAAILGQIRADYAAFPFVTFTLQAPSSGPFVTLYINKTPSGGEPGGLADEIDLGNLNLSTTAAIDVNGLLGGPGEPAATSADFVAMTATIAAHELGHTLGLQHMDSFGPIGFGVHAPPGVGNPALPPTTPQFLPSYPGPQAAWETTDDIMASPASVGSTLFDTLNSPLFGERDDIKLAFDEAPPGVVVNEQTALHGTMQTAQPLNLVPMQVPNTLTQGFDAGKVFGVAAAAVPNGSLQIDPSTGLIQPDFYAIQGRAGDVITIQALSYALTRITNKVDTELSVYDSSGNLVPYYSGQAFNDNEFESPDAAIYDLKLPADGIYYVEVNEFVSPQQPAVNGNYELFMYRFQAGNAIPASGSNSTFIVGRGNDTIIGRGGQDTVQDSGAASYVLTNTSLQGTGTATLANVTNAVLTGAPGGSTFNLSGWTGTATLIGGSGGTNTLIVNQAGNFTLTNNELTVSTGAVFNLVNIQNVVLTGAPTGSTFDLSGWTGTATINGLGTGNTVIATRAANFVLTSTGASSGSLSISTGGVFTLNNVGNAVLTGGASGSTFDVRGWTGTDILNSLGGANPIQSPQGVAIAANEGAGLGGATTLRFTDLGSSVATNYISTINWCDSSPSSNGTATASGSTVSIGGNHSFQEEGTYTVTTTLSQGAAFSVIASSVATVADVQLTNLRIASAGQGEGSSTPFNVATFTDPGGSEPISDYTATITWGGAGGQSTSGTVVSLGGGNFTVTTSRVLEEGSYPVSVTVVHDQLPAVTASGTITVADAPLSASSSNLSTQQGIALKSTQQVATFIDGFAAAPLGDFTATVTWGDGSSSSATVTQPGGAGTAFIVSAGHTYAVSGTFTANASILDVGGSSATTSFQVTVAPSIMVLNSSASGALTLTGTVAINIAGAIVVDSSSQTALSASGNSSLTAAQIQVVGKASISNGAVVSPSPTTGVPAILDPLAGLAAPTGGTNQGSVSLSKGSQTINPGIYSSISVSGNGTSLVLNPGVYIIKGGGFSVSNSATVSGSGVTIYNAGSNFPSAGGTFGGISLGSSGTISISAPTSGAYRGILFFQSRDNTRAISLNASSVTGISGTVYAPAAAVSLGGSSQLKTAMIVNTLTLSGNGGSALVSVGSDASTSGTVGQLLGNNLYVYLDNANSGLNSGEQAWIASAIAGLSTLLVPYHVSISEVSDPTLANVVIDVKAETPIGGLANGVLAYYESNGTSSEISLVRGWNWYVGANPGQVGRSQYDFQTVVTHELGHALGLGHSPNPNSVMFASLTPGQSRRTMTVADLGIPSLDSGPEGLHSGAALGSPPMSETPSATIPSLLAPLFAQQTAVAAVRGLPSGPGGSSSPLLSLPVAYRSSAARQYTSNPATGAWWKTAQRRATTIIEPDIEGDTTSRSPRPLIRSRATQGDGSIQEPRATSELLVVQPIELATAAIVGSESAAAPVPAASENVADRRQAAAWSLAVVAILAGMTPLSELLQFQRIRRVPLFRRFAMGSRGGTERH
jgi:hypothetical protein